MKEGAGSLYHPEILENPAARPGPGHGPATAATRPGESPDTHFFQAWKYYNGWRSIGIVLHRCQCSNSSSTPRSYSHTPKVCNPPNRKSFTTMKQFHNTETNPAACSWRGPWPRGGVTFWVTPSFPWLGLGGIGVRVPVLAGGLVALRVRVLVRVVGCSCGGSFEISLEDPCGCGWFGVLSFTVSSISLECVFSCGSGCGFIYMAWVYSASGMLRWGGFLHGPCRYITGVPCIQQGTLQAYSWGGTGSICIGGRIRHCSPVDRHGILWCSCTVSPHGLGNREPLFTGWGSMRLPVESASLPSWELRTSHYIRIILQVYTSHGLYTPSLFHAQVASFLHLRLLLPFS